MKDKQNILNAVTPRVVLEPMTDEALESVPHGLMAGGYICIRDFPFRIGRESRIRMAGGREQLIERPKLDGRAPNNDLYLIDDGKPLNISREHCQIIAGGGDYYLVDRGSACGISVNNKHIAGHDEGGSCQLSDGDLIALGTASSPYQYRFITLD